MQVSTKLHTPVAIHPQKPPVLIALEARRTEESSSGRLEGENNFLSLPELESWFLRRKPLDK
jgi:hypothetical protein